MARTSIRPPAELQSATVLLTAATLYWNMAHGMEELRYGFQLNFGLSPTWLGLFFCLGYLGEVITLLMLATRPMLGCYLALVVNALIAITSSHHVFDILFAWPYREGIISKAIEAALIISAYLSIPITIWAIAVARRAQKQSPF
ncbi:MAG TPA: hypothetical protein VF808_06540 [Ktedonobacterales bacterium]